MVVGILWMIEHIFGVVVGNGGFFLGGGWWWLVVADLFWGVVGFAGW